MNEELDPNIENLSEEEIVFEQVLRPKQFDDFFGQEQIVDNLKVFIEAASQRNDALDHTLLHGPPGLGKTTLAYIIANELVFPELLQSECNAKEIYNSVRYILENPSIAKKQLEECNKTLDGIRSKTSSSNEAALILRNNLVS